MESNAVLWKLVGSSTPGFPTDFPKVGEPGPFPRGLTFRKRQHEMRAAEQTEVLGACLDTRVRGFLFVLLMGVCVNICGVVQGATPPSEWSPGKYVA